MNLMVIYLLALVGSTNRMIQAVFYENVNLLHHLGGGGTCFLQMLRVIFLVLLSVLEFVVGDSEKRICISHSEIVLDMASDTVREPKR